MTSVFEFDDYKAFLGEACRSRRTPVARLADAAGIHRQYLSRVLNHKGHLSDEQALLAGRFLGLTDDAIAYFLLLVQEAKAAQPEVKRYFQSRRATMRQSSGGLSRRLSPGTRMIETPVPTDLSDFYSDVGLQTCYAYLFIPRFQRSRALLRERLRVDERKLKGWLERLEDLDLVEHTKGQWIAKASFLHLARDSALSRQNHRNWRIAAASQPMDRGDGEMFFSCTVTSDRRARTALIGALRALISDFHASLPPTADEEVFQLNIDVFNL